jgi:hypothetical protein
MGRNWRYVPRPADRRTKVQIAALLGISPPTLEKHYAVELADGEAVANFEVVYNLWHVATGTTCGAPKAMEMWLRLFYLPNANPGGRSISGCWGGSNRPKALKVQTIQISRAFAIYAGRVYLKARN